MHPSTRAENGEPHTHRTPGLLTWVSATVPMPDVPSLLVSPQTGSSRGSCFSSSPGVPYGVEGVTCFIKRTFINLNIGVNSQKNQKCCISLILGGIIGRTVLFDMTSEFVLIDIGIILEVPWNPGNGQDTVPLATPTDGPRLCWAPWGGPGCPGFSVGHW